MDDVTELIRRLDLAAEMAKANRLGMLQYLLDMAIAEAIEQAYLGATSEHNDQRR